MHTQQSATLAAALRDLGTELSHLQPVGKLGVPRPVQRFVGGDLVVEVASNEAGAVRIRREVHGRQWASSHQIPTARLHAADGEGAWLVGEWLPPIEPEQLSTDYLMSALETATAIAQAPPPPAGPPAQRWRTPRHLVAGRTVRGIFAGFPLMEWWRARKAAAEIPTVPVAHGDYYHRNVVAHARGSIAVVDWEYLGPATRYTDLIRLWSVLPLRSQREEFLHLIFANTPTDEHRGIATLAWWLALRRLGENVKAPAAIRNAADTAHARAVVPEARAVRAAVG